MGKIGIFYGSSMGYSEHIANLIQHQFGSENADVYNVTDASIEEVQKYDNLILGCSSWGKDELQEDMEDFFHEILKKVDFKGKKTALFGLGDQAIYGHQFLEAMGVLYSELKELNVDIIGQWPAEGYNFKFSEAYFDDKFVGLAIDEENQEELSSERVQKWVEILKKDFI